MSTPVAWAIDKLLEGTVVGSFSRSGYAARSRLESWIDPPSLAGKTVLLTGATSGLGLEIAARVASLGAALTFVARDSARAQAAAESLAARSSNHRIDFLLGDVSDLTAMRRVGETMAARGGLDVLIHNAGEIASQRTLSPQGYELTTAAQLLGPFHLTRVLSEALRSSHPGRVISVSSGGMYSQRFDLATLEMTTRDYDGVTAYAKVKRAQLVLNHEWANRTDPTDVIFSVMHPGWTDTPGLRTSLPRFYSLARPLLRTPTQGADTVVWLAASRDAASTSGDFWLDRHRRYEHKVPWTRPRDARREEKLLWDWCEERTRDY